MKKLSLFLFVCISLFPCNSFGQKFNAVRVLASRSLKPLNMAAFNTNISNMLARQSFAQLLSSNQLLKLSAAEQTLLLTHKFIEANHRMPLTEIRVNDEIIPADKYNDAQKMETYLGRSIQIALNNPNTPTAIKAQLRQLQRDFSPRYENIRILEDLNDWITEHDAWPREIIKPNGPLTPQEEYETALAKSANHLTAQTEPGELDDVIDQIRTVRAYYDESYTPQLPQVKETAKNTPKDDIPPFTEQEIIQIAQRPANFYNNENLPRNPATGKQQVLPTPDVFWGPATHAYPVTMDQIVYPTLTNLLHWLEKHPNSWPSIYSVDPQTAQLAKEIKRVLQEPLGKQELIKIYKQHFGTEDYTIFLYQ